MPTNSGQLIVQHKGEVIQTLPLTMPVLRIGRGPENGLPLPHQMVSRNHAELRMEPQEPILTDLGSTYGTFIGAERLLPNQPRVLKDGTTFRLGPYSLTYQVSKPSAHPLEPKDEQQPEQALPAVTPVPVAAPVPVLPQALQPSKSALRSPTDGLDGNYLRYLPDIFQGNDFLKRYLHIFEDIWEPLEQRQDHIAMYFDPRTCPALFLPWLASWLDLPLNPHWPEARQRRLLSQAMELYSWRGTSYGLKRMIEVCTGLTPEITELPSQPFVFRIRITLPPGSSGAALDKDLIEELIQMHKPAHAGYILEVNT
jgi:phage tail-like protein